MKKQILIQTDNITPPQIHIINVDTDSDDFDAFLNKIYDKFNLHTLHNSTQYKLIIYSSQSGILYRQQLNKNNWHTFDNAWLFVQ